MREAALASKSALRFSADLVLAKEGGLRSSPAGPAGWDSSAVRPLPDLCLTQEPDHILSSAVTSFKANTEPSAVFLPSFLSFLFSFLFFPFLL